MSAFSLRIMFQRSKANLFFRIIRLVGLYVSELVSFTGIDLISNMMDVKSHVNTRLVWVLLLICLVLHFEDLLLCSDEIWYLFLLFLLCS